MTNTTKEMYRDVRRASFTMINNNAISDADLPLAGKGLLVILLSNSKDLTKWQINMKEIISRSKDGRTAHYTALNSLISAGYVARVEVRNKKNQFEKLIYLFSDTKQDILDEVKWYNENGMYTLEQNRQKKSIVPIDDSQKQEIDGFLDKLEDFGPCSENMNVEQKSVPKEENGDFGTDSGILNSDSKDSENLHINNNKITETKPNKNKEIKSDDDDRRILRQEKSAIELFIGDVKMDVIEEFHKDGQLLNNRSIESVSKKVISKFKRGQVPSLYNYMFTSFQNKHVELEERRRIDNLRKKEQDELDRQIELRRQARQEQESNPTVPFYNWLEDKK